MNPIRFHRELAQRGYEVEVVNSFILGNKHVITFFCRHFDTDKMTAFIKSLGAEVTQFNEYGFDCYFKKGC